MPAVAVITLILVGAAVAVIAFYLIYIAALLAHVVGKLNKILPAVGASGEQAAPIGEVAGAINRDLEAAARALHATLPPDLTETNGGPGTGYRAVSE